MKKIALKNYFKIEIFCSIKNIFAVIFGQFNASLLHKSIKKKRNLTNPKCLICNYIVQHNVFPNFVRSVFLITSSVIISPFLPCSHSGAQCITCSYKATSGLLYPLERGFIYVHKPPVHLRFEEIACVNFARGTTTTRSFDFEIETKQGNQYTFSSIERYPYAKCFSCSIVRNIALWELDLTSNEKTSVQYPL